MQLWNYIRERMLKNPLQTVWENTAHMTYEELVIYAEKFSEKIAGEQCCAVMCRSELAAAIGVLSCLAAGVTAVPLPVRYGMTYCRKILCGISPTALITDVSGELEAYIISDSEYENPENPPAFIMFTSGTTGSPKGIMLSGSNILANLRDISRYFKIGKDDNILIARPLYHCAVLNGEFFISLVKGVRIRFYSGKLDPAKLLSLIDENGITVFCGTPTLLSIAARMSHGKTYGVIKSVAVSGECLSADTAKKIRRAFPAADIYHVYGLTEASPRVCCLAPELFDSMPEYVGVPLESVEVKIVKSDGTEAKNGEDGILWISGENISRGYYKNPYLTEKTHDGKWFCTGDSAVRDKINGMIKIKGRADDMIIRAGMNIYPQEIESVLRSDPRTRDVMVYGIKDKDSGTSIGMKISGDFADKKEVRRLCVERLPGFQIPSVIELTCNIPKSNFGKIIRGGKI